MGKAWGLRLSRDDTQNCIGNLFLFALSVTHGVTPPPDGGRLKGSPYGRAVAHRRLRGQQRRKFPQTSRPPRTRVGANLCVRPKIYWKPFVYSFYKEDLSTTNQFYRRGACSSRVRALKAAPDTAGRRRGLQGGFAPLASPLGVIGHPKERGNP